ncbi:MAG: hypothetical protein V2I39_02250 [Erythrobacter sp.]|jgi:hypothetical protein|nr:hypothetical protein [Erythrobacter sp.]
MTKTPKDPKKDRDSKKSGPGAGTLGAAAIGSAAIAAALLYAGRRFTRKSGGEPTASGMKDTVPSGEKPETD